MSRPARADDAPAVVLVVDDNPTSRYVIGTWLTRAGHTVIEAADGTEGLALLAVDRGDPPELAVVDVRLPDMSGFEVCERIKADPRTAGMPVIHVSATAVATADRTQGLDRGADAYLTEPIAPSELVATVAAVMRYARARSRAERLASRLTTLNQVTLDVYAALDGPSFLRAAAAGASALVQDTATVIAQSPENEAVHLGIASPDGTATSGIVPSAVLDRLTRNLDGQVGTTASDLPAAARAAGAPDGLPEGDLVLFAARTKRTRPALCVAVGAAALRDPEDSRLLTQFAQACALALEALRNYSEEHALAVTLQRAFLPDSLPAVPGVELAVRYLPATSGSEIGGDFYEAVDTPDGLILAVGDVAGHSLQAAIVMGELRHALRVYAIEGHGLQVLLEHLDNLMCRERPGWTATLCLMRLEPGHRRLEVANGGHLPPLLLDADGGSRFVTEHGPLLGTDFPRPAPVHVDIAPGTRIVMVTDGLIEVRGVDLADSLQDLRAAAVAGPELPGPLCDNLLEVFGRDHDDDVVIFSALVDGA